jgi:hypothetical protein
MLFRLFLLLTIVISISCKSHFPDHGIEKNIDKKCRMTGLYNFDSSGSIGNYGTYRSYTYQSETDTIPSEERVYDNNTFDLLWISYINRISPFLWQEVIYRISHANFNDTTFHYFDYNKRAIKRVSHFYNPDSLRYDSSVYLNTYDITGNRITTQRFNYNFSTFSSLDSSFNFEYKYDQRGNIKEIWRHYYGGVYYKVQEMEYDDRPQAFPSGISGIITFPLPDDYFYRKNNILKYTQYYLDGSIDTDDSFTVQYFYGANGLPIKYFKYYLSQSYEENVITYDCK